MIFPRAERAKAIAYVNKLCDTPTIQRLEIVGKRKLRTDDQNGWLWGCVYPILLCALNEAGWEFTNADQVHEFFKGLFLKEQMVNKHTGEIIEFPNSTAKMDTLTFSTYVDKLKDYGEEYLGIRIPDPDPNWKYKFERK